MNLKGHFSSQGRGRRCEQIARQHFEKSGYVFVTANLRLYCAEVDLLLLSPDGELVLVEVKSINEDLAWREAIGQEQWQRLSRAFEHLIQSSPRPVCMHLAAVDQYDVVTVFHDFFAD